MRNDSVSPELFRDVERFLYLEARMLEDNRFDDWLNCFSEDVRYWMPIQESTDASFRPATEADTFALFDDDKKSLELRSCASRPARRTPRCRRRRPSGSSPTSRLNRMARRNSLRVRSSFMVYQERRGQHGVTFFGRRDDVLRQVGGGFKISQRRIDLAQKVLPTTISIFF